MKVSYVYILKCSDETYYTGVTSNLDVRMMNHESGFYTDCYNANRRPLELVFYAEFTDINMANGKRNKSKSGLVRKKKHS
jgi:putative endonuclease